MAVQAIVGLVARVIVQMVVKRAIAQLQGETTKTAATVVRGMLTSFRSVNITTNASFKLYPGFHAKWNAKFRRAQMYLDNQVLMDCDPYTPLLTGTMIRSGQLGSRVGYGKVTWITPYVRRQYYFGRTPGTSRTGPLRGRKWFERSKEVNKDKWIRGVKQIIKHG